MELYRAIVEVRHLAPRYLDNRGQIIEKFKDKYPEFSLESGFPPATLDSTTRLRSTNRGIEAFTHGGHTGLEMRFEPFDLEAFAADAERFCRTVIRDIFKLEKVIRVGMRFYHRRPISNRDLLSFTLHKMLHSKDDFSDLSIMTTNWLLRFETVDDEYAYNLQFYPEMIQEEGAKKFTGHLVADFDAYQNDLPISAVTSLRNGIHDAYDRSLSLGTRFLEGIMQ